MQPARLARWIGAYERAWRTPGTAPLAELFTVDVTYRNAPFASPTHGLEDLARFWESARDGADEVFAMTWEPVAVQGDVAVVRVEVDYGDPPAQTYRDLWIIVLDPDGRCRSFEEWPYFPGQPLGAGEAGGLHPAG
jgi:hypothetical protein